MILMRLCRPRLAYESGPVDGVGSEATFWPRDGNNQ